MEPQDSAGVKRRRRWLKRIGIVVAVLVALAACWFGWESLQRRRFEERLAVVRASELHAQIEAQLSEEIPDERNAAPLIAEAYRILEEAVDKGEWVTTYDSEEQWTLVDLHPDILRGLEALAPSFDAFEKACARPVYVPPEGNLDFQDMCNLVVLRTRFHTDAIVPAVDQLLALADAWQPRTGFSYMYRDVVRGLALGILQRAIADGSLPADAPTARWIARIESADTLDDLPLELAFLRQAEIALYEAMLRGEDPFAESRETFRELEELLEDVPREGMEGREEVDSVLSAMPDTPWYTRWYARPWVYLVAAEVLKGFEEAVGEAGSETSVRAYASRAGTRWHRLFRYNLECLAALRVARTALAVHAGGEAPKLANPFTGEPLEVRREGKRVVVRAQVPSWARVTFPELLEWVVPIR